MRPYRSRGKGSPKRLSLTKLCQAEPIESRAAGVQGVSVDSNNAHAIATAGHVDGDLSAVAGNFNVGNAVT